MTKVGPFMLLDESEKLKDAIFRNARTNNKHTMLVHQDLFRQDMCYATLVSRRGCEYCGSIHHQDRCPSCGAPRKEGRVLL